MTRLEVSNSCILPTAGIKLNLCPLLQSQITDLDSAKGRVYLQLCHPRKISSYEFRRKFKSLFLVYLKKKKERRHFRHAELTVFAYTYSFIFLTACFSVGGATNPTSLPYGDITIHTHIHICGQLRVNSSSTPACFHNVGGN